MTMEQKSPREKKSLHKFLLPKKIPNKVGIVVDRSQSARNPNSRLELGCCTSQLTKVQKTVLERPLSLDLSKLSPKTNGIDMQNENGIMSVSDSNLRDFNSEFEQLSYEKTTSHVDIPKETRRKSSADSLARKSLLAAHLLHLIPTTKARQRNFLQGKVGIYSLLGQHELEKTFPNREASVFVGTWNMNGHGPPDELNDFVLPVGMEHVPDILVFGTQESCPEKFEWEVKLQETLGPTHLLYHSVSLGTIHMAIFLRRDVIWYASLPEDASLSVRPGTAFRTKGAVATAFMIFGTSFLFVTAHLTAHQEKVKERVSDVRKITHSLDLPKNLPVKNKSKDVTQNFDYVFWSGDLNFRLSTPRAKVLEWLAKTKFPLPPHLPHGYLHHDQLRSVLADGAAFKGFQEAKIMFPPTYKYDPGTQNFDTSSKQRAPAYTDRILYKQRQTRRLSGQLETPPLRCLIYDSVPTITTSDHKPVWGVFKAHLRPGLDTFPLAAGLFNRDVYLEGLKRRAATIEDNKASSTVCSLQ